MIELDIATATTRTQKQWKNKKTSWDNLVKKLSATHRTAETFQEYLNADKQRQSEIKDIGGFVGGYLIGGMRNLESVKHRQIITLDIDFGSLNFWETFQFLYDNAALIYSTHKHSPANPRFRLVMPLSRPVSFEEYEAITRRLAGNLGIHQFDSTTFQPYRLMYWPSTAKDAEYLFKNQNGVFIDPDDILNSYVNWQDVSEWPVCLNETALIKQSLKKQENPLEKPGLIGSFCRAYTVPEAIAKFLPNEYEDAGKDRYTYTEGSTNAGAIVYDDVFIYSHHSTDPISGQLCNAFDLVRLHKFGNLDPKKSLETMLSFASADGAVIKEMGIFNDIPADENNNDWLQDLETNKNGAYLPKINNLVLILKNDINLIGKIAYNDFDHREFITGSVPWNKKNDKLRYSVDADEAGLRHYVERTYNIFNVNKLRDAVTLVALKNSFHPITDYLNTLVWDGVPRLDLLFVDALGAENSEYTRAVTRKSLTAAVARVYEPGIKFDYVLTTISAQGMRKSSLFRELGVQWFSDSLDSMEGKDALEQLQGAWIIELGELSSLRKSELETVKHFITKQEDRFRVAYGRKIQNFLRQCVFFASTNEITFLRDPTGNRRFWPVPITKRYAEKTIDVNQLWAEAKHRYKEGELLYLSDELEKVANSIQSHHAEKDELVGLVEKYLETPLPINWDKLGRYERKSYLADADPDPIQFKPPFILRDKVCVAELWCEVLGDDYKSMTNNNTKRLHTIMQNMVGWERAVSNRNFSIYGAQRAYVRKLEIDGKAVRSEVSKSSKG